MSIPFQTRPSGAPRPIPRFPPNRRGFFSACRSIPAKRGFSSPHSIIPLSRGQSRSRRMRLGFPPKKETLPSAGFAFTGSPFGRRHRSLPSKNPALPSYGTFSFRGRDLSKAPEEPPDSVSIRSTDQGFFRFNRITFQDALGRLAVTIPSFISALPL